MTAELVAAAGNRPTPMHVDDPRFILKADPWKMDTPAGLEAIVVGRPAEVLSSKLQSERAMDDRAPCWHNRLT